MQDFHPNIHAEHYEPNFYQHQQQKQAMNDFEYCQKLQEEENLKQFQPQNFKKQQTNHQKRKKNNNKTNNARGWETIP